METTNYICNQCTKDLQAWIDKCAEILPELDDTIARLDNVRVSNNEGGNGSRSAGSSAPLNLDAMQLKINLASLTQTAEHYAKDQHAAVPLPLGWVVCWCRCRGSNTEPTAYKAVALPVELQRLGSPTRR